MFKTVLMLIKNTIQLRFLENLMKIMSLNIQDLY